MKQNSFKIILLNIIQNIKMSEILLNKIYQGLPNWQASPVVSKVRLNREYLISQNVADELNTYRTWDPFPVLNDAYEFEYKNGEEQVTKGPGAPGVRSIFNRSGAVMLGNGYDFKTHRSSEWRLSNNVPLIDTPENRRKIKEHSGCTIKELVEASSAGKLGREIYSYSDFMYCKYLGKVPNNYMITLRRFPIPVDDYISNVGFEVDENVTSQQVSSIGCLVTWMGTPGNDMSNILKYSYKMPFTWKDAQWQSVQGSGDDQSNPLNSIAAAFDPTYRKHYQEGSVGNAFNGYVGKFFGPMAGTPPYNLEQINGWRDDNKVYGPIDAIKGTFMRAETGLEFDQKISIQFDYELRSYNGINPRQAMLDLLSNILNVTYTTGTFWGGGYRGVGVGQNNIFSNLKMFKANGGFTSFIDAFSQDFSTLTKSANDTFRQKYGGDPISMLKAAANAIGGMLLGGMLNKLGRPSKIYASSLLSPAPVGLWHLTIGNPHHPIMSIGNMILTNTTIEHYGPLGLDDFPTGLKVTCELERGKPRDLRDIEKLYMHGNDRIYSSMGPEIKKMYENSKEYKNKGVAKTTTKHTGSDIKDSTNETSAVTYNKNNANVTTVSSQNVGKTDDIKAVSINEVWKKYFGMQDEESILIAAKEQENGSQKKKSK